MPGSFSILPLLRDCVSFRDLPGDIFRVSTNASEQRRADGRLEWQAHEVKAREVQHGAPCMPWPALIIQDGQIDPTKIGTMAGRPDDRVCRQYPSILQSRLACLYPRYAPDQLYSRLRQLFTPRPAQWVPVMEDLLPCLAAHRCADIHDASHQPPHGSTSKQACRRARNRQDAYVAARQPYLPARTS